LPNSQKGKKDDWEEKYLHVDIPWDVGEPEKELVRLVESGYLKPTDNVLDLGCGTGTDSIYLAKKGFQVVGIDISPSAVKKAETKAKNDQVTAQCHFYPRDALDLSFLKSKFDFVFDKTCLGGIDSPRRGEYVRSVKEVLAPSAKFLLIAISDSDSSKDPGNLSQNDIQNLFGAEFAIVSIEPTTLKHVGHEREAWKVLLRNVEPMHSVK